MTPHLQATRLLWTISAVLLSVAAFALFAQEDLPLNDFSKDLHIYYPSGDGTLVVCKEKFEAALVAHCASPKWDVDHRYKAHDIWYKENGAVEKLKGGVTASKGSVKQESPSAPSPSASPAAVPAVVGHHVTQYVSFASMKELQVFLLETQFSPDCEPKSKAKSK